MPSEFLGCNPDRKGGISLGMLIVVLVRFLVRQKQPSNVDTSVEYAIRFAIDGRPQSVRARHRYTSFTEVLLPEVRLSTNLEDPGEWKDRGTDFELARLTYHAHQTFSYLFT